MYRGGVTGRVAVGAVTSTVTVGRYSWSMAEILVLVDNDRLRELIAELIADWLPNHSLTIVRSPSEIAEALARRPYSLAIITNFGVRPWAAVNAVPRERDCPVLFLTGFMDDAIKAECVAKHIRYLMAPIDAAGFQRELRVTLDDVVL